MALYYPAKKDDSMGKHDRITEVPGKVHTAAKAFSGEQGYLPKELKTLTVAKMRQGGELAKY
jgi:hypothetical protein